MVDINQAFREHAEVLQETETLIPDIARLAERMSACLEKGGKVCWMGNGGSAADSQHLAAELVGRFTRERQGLASIALTTDTSILTAVGNDYGYDTVFERQVEALCAPSDVVVGISTSGNSANVLKALRKARDIGACTVAFTGEGGGKMAALVDHCLAVPSQTTARIQEAHLLIGHVLCDWVEATHAKRASHV